MPFKSDSDRKSYMRKYGREYYRTNKKKIRKRNLKRYKAKREHILALAVKNTRRRVKLLGCCVYCSRVTVCPGATVCVHHYLKKLAWRHLGDQSHWKFLMRLFVSQFGVCLYTRIPLVFGKNASLDHKFPVSRFPELKHDLNNVEWIDRSINDMKRDRTPDEFLAACKLVASINRGSSVINAA